MEISFKINNKLKQQNEFLIHCNIYMYNNNIYIIKNDYNIFVLS